MKYILTGAGGFIGSNLSYELVKQGHEVVGIDNLSTGFYANVEKSRFSKLSGQFDFIKKDINDRDLYKKFDGADAVLHLAALARVSFSTEFPLESNYANINGTLNVLQSARMAGVKRVVFSSSSSVYGGEEIHFPTPETERLCPRSNYALQKMAGENYCRLYSELYGLDTACLRYFNAIGAGSRPGGAYSAVVPAFFHAALNNEPCTINGDGNAARDYCPVRNIVQANILASQYPKNLNGECFNIALGETRTVNNVYEKICELIGKEVPKTHGPDRKGDPKRSHADIAKAKKILGYDPTTGFDECMEEIHKWWSSGCKF